MAEDRRIREAESEAYQAAAVERTTRLSSRIAYLEKELQNTTKDFILCESPAAHLHRHTEAPQMAANYVHVPLQLYILFW